MWRLYNKRQSQHRRPSLVMFLDSKSKNGMPLLCGLGIFALIPVQFVVTLSMSRRLNTKPILLRPMIMGYLSLLAIVATSFIWTVSSAGSRLEASALYATKNGTSLKSSASLATGNSEFKTKPLSQA